MANIELDQIECLNNYQVFSKYFSDTPLAECADFTITNSVGEVYNNIESFNHSQVLIQRLLIGANPTTFKELFDFFCKNKYIDVKPCCDFNLNSKQEYFLYFIGHNDNRSLFGESASMMFNFVATLIVTNIDHIKKSLGIKLSFKPYSPSDKDFYDATQSHQAKVHTITRIAKKHQNDVFELISELKSFLERHGFDRSENEDVLISALNNYSNTLDASGLPIAYIKPTVMFLTHKHILALAQTKSTGEVIQWIKQDICTLKFNFDLEFCSTKLDKCLNVFEMSDHIAQSGLKDVLDGDWFAIIHPFPTKEQMDHCSDQAFKKEQYSF